MYAAPDFTRLLHALRRFNDLAAEVSLWTAIILLLMLLALNATVVGVRLGFGFYAAWVFEISRALIIGIVFLGSVYLYRHSEHVAVSLVIDLLPHNSTLKRLFAILCELAVLVFALVVLWQALAYQPILFQRLTPALRLPENVISIGVPIAYFLILLNSIEALCSPRRLQQ